MPAYLQGSDIAANFTQPPSTAQILAASSLIDGYLGRREGLLCGVDYAGTPVYMLGMTPTAVLTLAAPISPGSIVTATVSGPANMVQVGDVLVADMSNANLTEALTVTSVSGSSITFASVALAHASGALLTCGVLINEKRTMPQNRPLTTLGKTPVANVVSGVGRYGYMRRGDDSVGSINTYNLLAVMSKFGGPPAWEPFTPQANSIDPQTGEMWVPAGVLLAYYTEIRVWYVAGWTYATLPQNIKQACVNIINNQVALQGIPGTIQTAKTGTASLAHFAAGKDGKVGSAAVDTDTALLLAPYRAMVMA